MLLITNMMMLLDIITLSAVLFEGTFGLMYRQGKHGEDSEFRIHCLGLVS